MARHIMEREGMRCCIVRVYASVMYVILLIISKSFIVVPIAQAFTTGQTPATRGSLSAYRRGAMHVPVRQRQQHQQHRALRVSCVELRESSGPRAHMPVVVRFNFRRGLSWSSRKNLSHSRTGHGRRSSSILRLGDTEDSGSRNSSSSNEPEEQQTNLPQWTRVLYHPVVQFLVCIALYMFHLAVLTQNQFVFPVQLLPASSPAHFTGIGWDSLAGISTLALYLTLQRRRRKHAPQSDTFVSSPSVRELPSLLSPTEATFPWNLPRENIRFRISSCLTAAALVQAYFWSGRWSLLWEDWCWNASGLGFPLTVAMHRSITVLLGHLSWVGIGSALLRWGPRPPKFFYGNGNLKGNMNGAVTPKEESIKASILPGGPLYFWFKNQFRNNCANDSRPWLWWAIGGYFVSSWLFNCADLLNHFILPAEVLQTAQESVVTQLVNPEYNDWAASLVGYIAPCLSAPWWEEVLYRGFGLAALTQLCGYQWAVLVQGIVFSAHHMSLTAALPLAVLGWTWALLYTASGNLWVSIMVHGLWNSRVFLGSWLGL